MDTRYQKIDFIIGEKVKVMADPVTRMTCPFCKGNTKIVLPKGKELFCQNCDNGVLTNRDTDNRQLVDGVVTGFRIEGKTEESEDDEWWYGAEEGEIGVRQEYFVEVPKDFWSDGTYESSKIQKIEEDSNETT